MAQWIECWPVTKVRAHAWVGGQVPSRGCVKGNHTLMILSHSFSLPSPLPKNKEIKSFRKVVIMEMLLFLHFTTVKTKFHTRYSLVSLTHPILHLGSNCILKHFCLCCIMDPYTSPLKSTRLSRPPFMPQKPVQVAQRCKPGCL